jgi:hypothetical protein
MTDAIFNLRDNKREEKAWLSYYRSGFPFSTRPANSFKLSLP